MRFSNIFYKQAATKMRQ